MKKISNWIFEHRTLFVVGIIVLVSIGYVEYEFADGSFLRLIDLTIAGLLATPTWELPIQHGVSQLLETVEGSRELARWIAIDGGIALLAGVINRSIQRVLSAAKSERLRQGVEPVKQEAKIDHVLIGAPEIISDFARDFVQDKNGLTVGVHIGDKIPYAFGQEMDHHINVSGLSEIVGRFAPSSRDITTIEAAGIDKADELTIVCIDPNNAIFYKGLGSEISPNFPSTLLKRISQAKLNGKKVNLILPEVKYLGRTVSIEKELRPLVASRKIDLRVVKPEQLVLAKIADTLRDVQADAELSILLIGEGNNAEDIEMLMNFELALDQIKLDGRKIKTALITHNEIRDGEKRITGENNGSVSELLARAHCVVCYGDSDFGTSTICRLLLSLNLPARKIIAIVERKDMAFDYDEVGLPKENVFFVYDSIIKSLKESQS